MRRLFRLIFIVAFLAPILHGQSGHEGISCYASRGSENKPYKRKLWDGYEISLGPARNSTGDDDECTAAIYNREGKVVYRTTGVNVVFDEDETGEDMDDDGHNEVVFKTDTGGGMHCCWSYKVISLWPRPHKLVDIAEGGAVDFRKDSNGHMEVWSMERGPIYSSMAETPFAQKVYRVRDGRLVDITREHCREILADNNDALNPERLKRFKADARVDPGSQADFDLRETGSALLARALQHTFCRQFDQALVDFDLWPEAGRNEMKAEFADAIKSGYPDFAARLKANK